MELRHIERYGRGGGGRRLQKRADFRKLKLGKGRRNCVNKDLIKPVVGYIVVGGRWETRRHHLREKTSEGKNQNPGLFIHLCLDLRRSHYRKSCAWE